MDDQRLGEARYLQPYGEAVGQGGEFTPHRFIDPGGAAQGAP
jgi:hypothetical protein